MKTSIYSLLIFSGLFFASCGESEQTANETAGTEVTQDTTVVQEALVLPEGWELTTNEEVYYLAITDSVTQVEMMQMSERLGAHYGAIVEYMTKSNIQFAGAPLTQWFSWDTTAYSVFTAGIPVAPGTLGMGSIQPLTIPAGQALKYTHMGSYESMADAHMTINEFFMTSGKDAIGGPWEMYITDPGTEPDTTKWISEIWYPVSGY